MPRIPNVIRGFRARQERQLSPEVCSNWYPELGARETEFAPRPRLALVPTRGFQEFARFGSNAETGVQGRITGMSSTLERVDRLAVSNGRSLRLYEDPARPSLPSFLQGTPDGSVTLVHYRPVYGCFIGWHFDLIYAAADGTLRLQRGRGTPNALIPRLPGTPDGHTPLGVTGLRADARSSDPYTLWISSAEDSTIRCYRVPLTRDEFLAEPGLNLDVTDHFVQMPESLFYHRPTRTLAVTDGATGDVTLFELTVNPERTGNAGLPSPWRRVSPGGIDSPFSNPFSLQYEAGDVLTRKPVHAGGVHLSADRVRVVDRLGKRVVSWNRMTGFPAGNTDLGPGFGRQQPCGFVGAEDTPRLYVDGGQIVRVGGGTGEGQLFEIDGTRWLPTRTLPTPNARLEFRRQVGLVPLDNSGRWMAWSVDRKVHLLDLVRDEVILNCAGAVDQITASSGRFAGIDGTGGTIKVSPPGARGVTGANAEPPQPRGTLEPNAGIVIPGWPRVNPRSIRSMAVLPQHVLVCASDYDLYLYERQNRNASVVRLTSDGRTVAVGVSGGTGTDGQVFIVRRGTADTNFSVYWWDTLPTNTQINARSGVARRMENRDAGAGNASYRTIRSAASDDAYFYAITQDGATAGSSVWAISTRVRNGTLSTIHLPATWGVDQAAYEGGSVWGLDFARGLLHGVIRPPLPASPDDDADADEASPSPPPTLIRSLQRIAGTSWRRDRSGDVSQGVTRRNRALTHDTRFLYDLNSVPDDYQLPDGTGTLFQGAAAFRLADTRLTSAYAWNPDEWQQDGGYALSSIRGRLISWTTSTMRLYDPDPGAERFPFTLASTRDVGCSAPGSIAIVEEMMFWLGTSRGGGTRIWSIGGEGDASPAPVISAAVEEVLDLLGDLARDGIAHTDDAGGHPCYVIGFRNPGITMCYDTSSEEWHTRTSKRLGEAPGGWLFPWQDPAEGHQRVEFSAVWRSRQYFGGYGANGVGIIAEPSTSNWYDIDGGPIKRVRVFGGLALEKRLIRYSAMRIDLAVSRPPGVTVPHPPQPEFSDPTFTLEVSNDGGRTWGVIRKRPMPLHRPTAPFWGMGPSRFRAYRVTTTAPLSVTMLGAYMLEPAAARRL